MTYSPCPYLERGSEFDVLIKLSDKKGVKIKTKREIVEIYF